MKKLLSFGAFLLLSTFVGFSLRASPPAEAAQTGGGAQGLEARVAQLEGELAAEKKRNDETQALLEQTLAYLEKQSKAGQALLGALDESEQQGFAVGENWRSRQTLLGGFRAYCADQQSGLPKVAAPPAPKPAAPVRRARQE
jgi:hypothetical protein